MSKGPPTDWKRWALTAWPFVAATALVWAKYPNNLPAILGSSVVSSVIVGSMPIWFGDDPSLFGIAPLFVSVVLAPFSIAFGATAGVVYYVIGNYNIIHK
jgi:hypothetical protein